MTSRVVEPDEVHIKGTKFPTLFKCVEYSRNPELPTIVVITGTSGSGKDTLMNKLVEKGDLMHVQTATSRNRRFKVREKKNEEAIDKRFDGCQNREEYEQVITELDREGLIHELEPKNAYLWMRWRRPGETKEEYYLSLISEYDLIESDAHSNSFYGLPRKSLHRQKTSVNSLPVVRVDINGAKTIREKLEREFNVLVIALVPDTWEQIKTAIRGRQRMDQTELEIRLKEDKDSIVMFPNIVHYILQNTRDNIEGQDGLSYSINILSKIIGEATR